MQKRMIIVLAVFLAWTADAQKRRIVKEIRAAEDMLGYHAGFYLADPVKGKILVDYKGDKYFTPASNTKIFTLYTSLRVLGDSIPGIYYRYEGDSLILWGTGDPSFFYERVAPSAVPDKLREMSGEMYLSDGHFADSHFGPGWAWDDYLFSYQVEKAPLPVFGNYFYVRKRAGNNWLEVDNNAFKPYFWLSDSLDLAVPVFRDYGSNQFEYFPRKTEEEFTRLVPFHYTNNLASALLSDTLERKIRPVHLPLAPVHNVIYSLPSDSLYRVLMQASDNFIAEQLLLTSAGVLSDTLKSAIAIRYALDSLLDDLPDKPLWVDGSGLSRYNQFTPRSIVSLWSRIYREFGTERIFPLLAAGGKSGTIAGLYNSDEPFIYGKTGTLRNHHCLSGFLITDRGNILIFAFMNGHYPGSSSTVKGVMDRILREVKSSY